jgi:plasmid replication initiation protein
MKRPVQDSRQLEFDILFDALPDIRFRDQRDAMERPLVNLGTHKRIEPITFHFGDDLFVRILPHQEFGWASIWDYDIIIWLLGQVTERFNRGETFDKPAVSAHPNAILSGIRRSNGGKDYEELRRAIARLQTTVIETNIWHGKKLRRFKRFTLIHEFEELEPGEATSGGMRFALPDWMIDSLKDRKGILAIHPDYFLLRGGIERFMYRLARKMAGAQVEGARIKMTTLHERSGSTSRWSDFAKLVRKAVEKNEIPEYEFAIYRNDANEEVVTMHPRGVIPRLGAGTTSLIGSTGEG